MEDDAPAVGVAGNEKVDISSTLSSSSASSSTRSRPTWGKVMRQTWARTSSRRLNSKSSTAPATAAGGPGGGLSKSAPEKDDEDEDKKRSKAKKERTKTTKKTRIRIDKAAEERRALTSDFSSSSSSSCASPSPSYISSSSSSYSRYGTFAQSASATLTAAGSARGPRGRFGYESLRAGRIAPLAASGPWYAPTLLVDEEVSWVIDERRLRKVSGGIVRKEEPSGKQRKAPCAVAGKDRDSVARRDRVAGGEKEKAKAESVEEEESEEAEPEAVGEDAAEEKGAFDLLCAYYPHSLASLTSLTTKKGKEKSERESDDESESESDRYKIVKAKGTGVEETKNVTIASEDDNEREGGKEKKNEASNGKRPRRKRRAVSAKRNDEGRLLRLRAKLCKSGDILLCMRRERSYDGDGDNDGSGDGGGASTPESSPELQGRDGRGRRADGEGQAQTDAAATLEAKTKKSSTPRKEEKESEAERAMEREMEELWKRASKPRRCSEPFAFPSRRSRGKARRADGDEAVGGDGGSGSRDRSNTISSFVLAFEERKDLSQLARERDQEKSERKSRWRAYSFITPRRNRNGSNAQPAALATPSSSSSSSALPQDSPAAAGVVQGRQRSSSLGAPRPNLNLIEQPLRQARSLSDDEGESGRLDDDDDIYGGGAANTFVDLDNRPRPHQQLLLHQQQLKAQRDRRRREREAAERKEEDERPHETTRDNGNKSEGSAKPSWRNLKLLFSSER
ncbi:uncharacterized protein ACA1_125080 [Acanthamoeba castellanii str. Neff]|uniref:Uncharacterized protein n=1 Tax=Acanthamoeba castellanii (strain ATCC 30010 / Neff) TaxID=1257118 RepID=L8GRB8_ACACF|nr:uncharacterized protein ACA1_125080 [Acanthamoeba castellanii str. Neff]ELR14666.1 hypothetical protein ACA1_125080 [Acanthamoeba castellanii str. Neff]